MSDAIVAPFSNTEYALLRAYVEGGSAAMRALQCQLDSLRYESVLYTRRRFFGLRYRARKVRRRFGRLRLCVDWGYGCEDMQLGDRRPYRMNDVVMEVTGRGYLCTELHIAMGRLSELRVVGLMRERAGLIEPFTQPIRALADGSAISYSAPWDSSGSTGPTNLVRARAWLEPFAVLGPDQVGGSAAGEHWLLRCENIEVSVPGRRLPLVLRRAKGATVAEIARFEAENNVLVPAELRELWSVTNGASFFGDVLRGTYDAVSGIAKGIPEILLLDNNLAEGRYVMVRGSQRPSAGADVYEIDLQEQRVLRRWSSLQECLLTILQDKVDAELVGVG